MIATARAPQPKPTQARKPEPHFVQVSSLRCWMTTKTPVKIVTTFGDTHIGVITSFDQFTIKLDKVLIFKHAIATITEIENGGQK